MRDWRQSKANFEVIWCLLKALIAAYDKLIFCIFWQESKMSKEAMDDNLTRSYGKRVRLWLALGKKEFASRSYIL
jgi:hypothetical protein